ncbi:type IV secretory system conjugative DNA transfer family protein [Chromobacterium vaccinii]|uniref:type IV secretory system conjugative DNA transfer family protein n=1 Tax=Chromobacterium vaccinii TaxID=1108595 RepID=UPI003C76F710
MSVVNNFAPLGHNLPSTTRPINWLHHSGGLPPGLTALPDRLGNGIPLGKLLCDDLAQVLHPAHPQFDQRERIAEQPLPGLLGLLGLKKVQLSSQGVPCRELNPRVCRKHFFLSGSDRQDHVLLIDPARSGKTTAIINPSLMHCHDSVVVIVAGDVPPEVENVRAQGMGQRFIRLDPFSAHNVETFNPFHDIRKNTRYELQDVQTIVLGLLGRIPAGWEPGRMLGAERCLTALVLHFLYQKQDPSLTDIALYVRDNAFGADEARMRHIRDNVHLSSERSWRPGRADCHPVIAYLLDPILTAGSFDLGKEISGYLDLIRTVTTDYMPGSLLAQNSRYSTFSLDELTSAGTRSTVLFTISPAKFHQLRSSGFAEIFIGLLSARLESMKPGEMPFLFMLDDYPQMAGNIAFLKTLIESSNGNARYITCIQELAQIRQMSASGGLSEMLKLFPLRVVFPPASVDAAHDLSTYLSGNNVAPSIFLGMQLSDLVICSDPGQLVYAKQLGGSGWIGNAYRSTS